MAVSRTNTDAEMLAGDEEVNQERRQRNDEDHHDGDDREWNGRVARARPAP